jgi:hypothetical protein
MLRTSLQPGRQFIALLLVALTAFAPLQAATPGVVFPPPHTTAYTHEQEIQLGRQGMGEVARQMQVLPDSDPIAQYVRSLGERLVPYVPDSERYPRFPYEFHVVNVKSINAFALPGGPVYVNLGTVQAADNEAQLAGVLAHEMAHVYERHATAQATKEGYAQVGLGILGALLGRTVAGSLANAAIGLGAGGLFLHYSRSAESEADHVGALLMYEAGYNPQALGDFFRKLESKGGAGVPQFLSDHPNPGNRAEAIDALVHSLPPRRYLASNSERFMEIHQIAGSVPGSAREAELRPASAPASGNPDLPSDSGVQTFNHGAYQVQYPASWSVVSGDRTSDVVIAPRNGVVQDAIAYGVLIREHEPEQPNDADAAMHELQQQLLQSNPGLRVIGHDEPIIVNGVRGRSVDLLGSSPLQDSSGRPLRERDWLVALPEHAGRVRYLVFVAPDSEFDRYRPTFEQMLRSLHLR